MRVRRSSNWRKGWDSNPRCLYRHPGFQDRCFRPLSHPSVRKIKYSIQTRRQPTLCMMGIVQNRHPRLHLIQRRLFQNNLIGLQKHHRCQENSVVLPKTLTRSLAQASLVMTNPHKIQSIKIIRNKNRI